MSERPNVTSDAAKAAYPDPETISVAGNTFPEWLQRQLQEAYDRGVRGEIMRRSHGGTKDCEECAREVEA